MFLSGVLPAEFSSLTDTEAALVTPAYGVGTLVKLEGGQQTALKGHTHLNVLNIQEVHARLPPPEVPIKIVMTTALTSAQRALALKSYGVNRDRVGRLLGYFRDHNPLFAKTAVDQRTLNSLPERGFLPSSILSDAQDSKHHFPSSGGAVGSSLDFTMSTTIDVAHDVPVPSTSSAQSHGSSTSSNTSDAVASALRTSTYRISASSVFVPYKNRDWLALSFPTLFPFGLGHYVPVPLWLFFLQTQHGGILLFVCLSCLVSFSHASYVRRSSPNGSALSAIRLLKSDCV